MRSQFSLKNQCLKSQREDQQPNLYQGLYLVSFLIRSFTVTERFFLSRTICRLFIQMIFLGVIPSKGLAPRRSQYKRIPKQYKSIDLLQPYFLTISGARYSQLPQRLLSFQFGPILQVKPKSQSLIRQFQSISTFYGFRSRQIRPLQCKLTIASATCVQIVYFQNSSKRLLSQAFLLLWIRLKRSPKGQQSTMKQTYFGSQNWQYSLILYFSEISNIQNQFFIIYNCPFYRHYALFIRFIQKRCLSYLRQTKNIQEQVPSPIFLIASKCFMLIDQAWQSIKFYESQSNKVKARGHLINLLSLKKSPCQIISQSQYSYWFLLSSRSMKQFLGLLVIMPILFILVLLICWC